MNILFGQENYQHARNYKQIIRERIERIASNSEEEIDYSGFLERIRYFENNPLNLNDASKEELGEMILLSDRQIYHLVAYREIYGELLSIYELQLIDGFDMEIIRFILPLTTIEPIKEEQKLRIKNVFKYGKHKYIQRYQRTLQKKKGYASPDNDSVYLNNPSAFFLGSPARVYLRYGFSYKNRVRWGFTLEKDPGEMLFRKIVIAGDSSLASAQFKNSIDYCSFHLQVNNPGLIKRVLIGDFHADFGQGLTLGTGISIGQGSEVINIHRSGRGFRPHTSASENNYFRGIATKVNFQNLNVSLFCSVNKIDATLSNTRPGQAVQVVTSFSNTGYHRTMNELLKKDALRVRLAGGHVSLYKNKFTLGITAYHTLFEFPVIKSSRPYNYYEFSGTENYNGGIDYFFLIGNYSFSGEVSISRSGGLAQIHNLYKQLSQTVKFTASFRSYQRNYQNFYANPFCQSKNNNEKGIYLGINTKLAAGLSLSAFVDAYNYLWVSSLRDRPVVGNEKSLMLTYTLPVDFKVSVRIKNKTYGYNFRKDGYFTNKIQNQSKTGFRITFEYALSEQVRMKNRFDFQFVRKNPDYSGTGFLMCHDLKWQPGSQGLLIYFRYALFDTDSYEERIYAYENDLLYQFSVPAYYYRGTKFLAVIRYKWKKCISGGIRLSHTHFFDKSTIGSGNGLIESNLKTEIKAQLILKLRKKG